MTTAPSDALSADKRAKMIRQIVAESYSADDMVGLARMIYVRVLFRLYGVAGGRADHVTPIARQITAEILREQIGFYVTPEDVLEFLQGDDDEAEEPETPPPARQNDAR